MYLQVPGFRHPSKIQKIFIRRFALIRFLAKTLRINKPAMKKFLKKSVVQSRLLNCRSIYKITTHNISGARKYVNNSDCRVLMTNYVCLYVFVTQ